MVFLLLNIKFNQAIMCLEKCFVTEDERSTIYKDDNEWSESYVEVKLKIKQLLTSEKDDRNVHKSK